MTEQDRQGFAELMLGLGETFGEPVSDARMEIYFRALSDMDLATIRVAAAAHVRVNKFFPRPAELREVIEGSLDDEAELAWMALLRTVRRVGFYGVPEWDNEVIMRSANELFGGWKALCAKLPGEGPELLGYAKQFKATYKSYARREQFAQLPPTNIIGMLES